MIRRYVSLAALLVAPFVRGGVTDSLEVTPSSGTFDVPPYAQAHTQTFSVKNTGGRTVDIAISAPACQPFEMNCTWSTFSLDTVAPNQSRPVTVTFTSGAPGWSGTISFVARVNDNQTVSAGTTVTVRVPQQAWVETKSLNPGTTVERSHCVAFPIGTNAAYECGDLRIAHALPSLRVRSDDRTPILLYNTAHAEPRPVILANVSAPSGGATNVMAKLTIRRGGSDVQVVDPTPFPNIPGDSTRRIALTYDASGDTTGVYPYTFTVTMTAGGSPQTLTASDTLVVVNRKASAFGAGWWLAGYERLVRLPGGGFLWVGGDGSTRRYVRDTTRAGEAYGAAGFERPDSLVLDAGVYVRKLRHRARVEFDANGRHVATKDPLGFATTFDNDPTSGRLRAVIHPPAALQPKHEFFYSGGSSPLLDSATGPAPNAGGARRKVTLTHAQRGKVTRITDPDNAFVEFTYASTNGVVITGRRNRSGRIQPFFFGANRLVETAVNLNLDEGATTTICPAEIRGLPADGCGSSALSPNDAVTTVDGPRIDVTDLTTIKIDRFGGPEIVTDPLGHKIRLYQGNRSMPGLVTRSVGKNGKTDDAFYNANGTLGALVDYGPLGPNRDAVTTFQWDPKWERVTQITYPELNVVRFGYDSATGNRIWQEDGRGSASRADFSYYSSGNGALLLASVTSPPDAQGQRGVDSVKYDALGNMSETRSPVGAKTTYNRDGVGRVTATRRDITLNGLIRQRDSTVYDLMDRDTLTSSFGPQVDPFGSPAATLMARRTWDDEGNLTMLERWAVPDLDTIGTIKTKWRYDLANRRVAEEDGLGRVDSTAYDSAGNVRAVVTRRGHMLSMTYDAVNRLLTRTIPSVTYDSMTRSIAALGQLPNLENPRYPFFPNTPDSGYQVALDTEVFTYDEMGRITSARNGDAEVTRTYFDNGLLKTERQRVRTIAPLTAGGTFDAHDYTIGYTYDLNGRRTKVAVPASVAPVVNGVVQDTMRFDYDPQMGALTKVTDLLGREFTYEYDGRSAVTSLTMPGGYSDRYRYTLDGLLSRDSVVRSGGGVFRAKTFTYNDARGKVTRISDAVGFRDVLGSRYSGLGYADSTSFVARRDTASATTYSTTEGFFYDALGNLVQSVTISDVRNRWLGSTSSAPRRFFYDTLSGRLGSDRAGDGETRFEYDSAGNTRFSYRLPPAGTFNTSLEDRASYYGADGRLRAADYRQVVKAPDLAGPTLMAFEEYRYDALGRRVLVRARRQCDFMSDRPKAQCNLDLVRRTVWDGTQELVEIQMPNGAVNGQVDQTERDTGFVAIPPFTLTQAAQYLDPNPYFGRVLYTHGLALDHPVSITRVEYTDDPQSQPGPGGQGPSRWGPLSIVPIWNDRGQADLFYFVESSDGKFCRVVNGIERCVRGSFPAAWFAYDRAASPPKEWHGTLVEDKADEAGTLYRRARYYEPTTGRFTQEDPIGLAGGLNLYGFAGGDPVNFSDPFGLCKNAKGEPVHPSECDKPLVDQSANAFALASGLFGLVRGLVTAGIEALAGAFVEKEAAAVVTNYATKAAAREALGGMELPAGQAAAARSAISRATTKESIELIRQPNGDLMVHLTRPGRNGFQVMQSTISPNGAKSVTQYGVDVAGRVVIDPKVRP